MNKLDMIAEIERVLPDWHATVPIDSRENTRELVNSSSEEDIADFLDKFSRAGKEWGFFPYAPFVQNFLNKTLTRIVKCDIKGGENIESVVEMLKNGTFDRIVLLSNHTSYSEANLIATFLYPFFNKYGFGNDLSVIAGPKVFNEKFKVFSSLHFNSILVAQSLSVASQEAALSPREIVKAAKKAIDDIKEKVKILLIFPEGARSRTGNLMPFLPGVLRLIDTSEKTAVLPLCVLGANIMLPINTRQLRPSNISISAGRHLSLSEIKDQFSNDERSKQDIMDFFGRKVAELMPEERRGHYAVVK